MTSSRTINEWYKTINSIYLDRNFYRDPTSIYMHLVEVIGGLTPLASRKVKTGIDPKSFLPKAIAWWLVLCGKVGVRDVDQMIWAKFPGYCPYCLGRPHSANCGPSQGKQQSPAWDRLETLARQSSAKNEPRGLAAWQRVFFKIYETDHSDHARAISRLLEELAELAEAVRLLPATPQPFLNEATDVFAWLMNIANGIDTDNKAFDGERGRWLETAFHDAYPDKCTTCKRTLCICAPLFPRTFLRLGEVPSERITALTGHNILSPQEILALFQQGAEQVAVGGQTVRLDPESMNELRELVARMLSDLEQQLPKGGAHSAELILALRNIEELVAAQRLTQEGIDELISVINAMPHENRQALLSFLTGVGSSAWVTAILKVFGS